MFSLLDFPAAHSRTSLISYGPQMVWPLALLHCEETRRTNGVRVHKPVVKDPCFHPRKIKPFTRARHLGTHGIVCLKKPTPCRM